MVSKVLVGCFAFNGPLRQYCSLYWSVSQREGERRERTDESKNVQTTPPAPTASAIGPCPTVIKIVGRPGTGSLPSTIAPPDHPLSKVLEPLKFDCIKVNWYAHRGSNSTVLPSFSVAVNSYRKESSTIAAKKN